jgi:hypothetical protein
MDQGKAEPGSQAPAQDGLAERGGYDPIRADGPLRQLIRLLRHQDAGRSPTSEPESGCLIRRGLPTLVRALRRAPNPQANFGLDRTLSFCSVRELPERQIAVFAAATLPLLRRLL